MVVGSDLIRFDTGANAVSGRLAVPGAAAIASVAVDAESGRLYLGHLGDAPDAPGTVSVLDRDGTLIGVLPAGVAPVSIAFAR